MKVYSQQNLHSDFTANLEFTINSPSEIFAFSVGLGTGEGFFQTGFSFSGYNGYLFDQSGNFFGGYQSGKSFSIQANVFDGNRLSYFYNDTLIANNIAVATGLNCFEFNKNSDDSVQISFASIKPSNYLGFLNDVDGIYLLSSETLFLKTN